MTIPRSDVACPKCGACEWELEADTQESVTYHVDFETHAFAETNREMVDMQPTDWFCMTCHEPADDNAFEALTAEFVDEKSGREWKLVEEDEMSLQEVEHDGPHEGCGVNLPHAHR